MDKKQYLEEMTLISEKHRKILDSITDDDSFETIVGKLNRADVYLEKARKVESLYEDYLADQVLKGDFKAFFTLTKRLIHSLIIGVKLDYMFWKAKRKLGN